MMSMRTRAELEATPTKHAGEPRIVAVDMGALDIIQDLNYRIFNEERVINTFQREDLLMLLAFLEDRPVGFKIGYRENRFVFYSAKGGVLPEFRRREIGRASCRESVESAAGGV